MKYLYVLLAVCVLPCLSLWGYPKKFNVNICGERDGSRWTSLWCDDGETNRYDYKILKFRRTFDLKEKPKNFKINVSADNRYRLFVNGKTVAAGPARGDVYNWYYDTLDIAPHLQKGKNTIAVMVWNMGDYRPCAQITMRTAFILDGAGEEEDFVSTPKKWKFKKARLTSPWNPLLSIPARETKSTRRNSIGVGRFRRLTTRHGKRQKALSRAKRRAG